MPPHRMRHGVQDIRTMAGRATQPGSNQRLYLRLCTLEMERSRREQEYVVAAQRADTAKRRVDRLSAEMNEILTKLGALVALGGTSAASPDSLPAEIEYKYGSGTRQTIARKDAA